MEWLNIAELEDYVRSVNKAFSLTRSRSVVRNEVQQRRGDPVALREYVEGLTSGGSLRGSTAKDGSLSALEFGGYLAAGDPGEVKALLAQTPEALHYVDPDNLWRHYAIKRTLAINRRRAWSERLPGIIGEKAGAIGARDGTDAVRDAETFLGALKRTLDRATDRLGRALQILTFPKVRQMLSKHLNMTLPNRGVTLEAVLRAHPETHVLFAQDGGTVADQEHAAHPGGFFGQTGAAGAAPVQLKGSAQLGLTTFGSFREAMDQVYGVVRAR